MFQEKLQTKSQLVFKTLSSMYISVENSEQDHTVFHINIIITT